MGIATEIVYSLSGQQLSIEEQLRHTRIFRSMLAREYKLFAIAVIIASAIFPCPTDAMISSPEPCPSNAALRADLRAVFAAAVTSPGINDLVRDIASLDPKKRFAVFDAAIAAASGNLDDAVSAVESSQCPSNNTVLGFRRVMYLVTDEWRLRDASDSAKLSAFALSVKNAVTAIAMGDALLPQKRKAILSPFTTDDAVAAARPVTTPGSCTTPNRPPSTIRSAPLLTPQIVAQFGIKGIVKVSVVVSDSGAIRSARFASDSLSPGVGAEQAIRESILSAAASTYTPEIKACQTVESTYLYAAEFN